MMKNACLSLLLVICSAGLVRAQDAAPALPQADEAIAGRDWPRALAAAKTVLSTSIDDAALAQQLQSVSLAGFDASNADGAAKFLLYKTLKECARICAAEFDKSRYEAWVDSFEKRGPSGRAELTAELLTAKNVPTRAVIKALTLAADPVAELALCRALLAMHEDSAAALVFSWAMLHCVAPEDADLNALRSLNTELAAFLPAMDATGRQALVTLLRSAVDSARPQRCLGLLQCIDGMDKAAAADIAVDLLSSNDPALHDYALTLLEQTCSPLLKERASALLGGANPALCVDTIKLLRHHSVEGYASLVAPLVQSENDDIANAAFAAVATGNLAAHSDAAVALYERMTPGNRGAFVAHLSNLPVLESLALLRKVIENCRGENPEALHSLLALCRALSFEYYLDEPAFRNQPKEAWKITSSFPGNTAALSDLIRFVAFKKYGAGDVVIDLGKQVRVSELSCKIKDAEKIVDESDDPDEPVVYGKPQWVDIEVSKDGATYEKVYENLQWPTPAWGFHRQVIDRTCRWLRIHFRSHTPADLYEIRVYSPINETDTLPATLRAWCAACLPDEADAPNFAKYVEEMAAAERLLEDVGIDPAASAYVNLVASAQNAAKLFAKSFAPHRFSSLAHVAVVSYETGTEYYDTALNDLKAWTAAHPDSLAGWTHLSYVYWKYAERFIQRDSPFKDAATAAQWLNLAIEPAQKSVALDVEADFIFIDIETLGTKKRDTAVKVLGEATFRTEKFDLAAPALAKAGAVEAVFDEYRWWINRIGIAHLKTQQYDQAAKIFKRLARSPSNSPKALPTSLYNLACTYSLMGDAKRGFTYLWSALEKGYVENEDDIGRLQDDSDLDFLRSQTDEWDKFIKEAEKRIN